MAAGVMERRVQRLVDRCHDGLDAAALAAEVMRRLPGVVPVEAAFFATVDPATLLFTSAVAQEPLAEATPLFLDNEFGRADVNKFAALARRPDPVMSLDRATRGRRSASPRYREIMAGLGLGDELRAALTVGHECWGVLCLHLADADAGFSERDLAVVRRIAPQVAAGLRAAVVRDAGSAPASDSPALVVLGNDLSVVSISPQADQWLAQIAGPRSHGLPLPVCAVAARVAGAADGSGDVLDGPDGSDGPGQASAVRLRTFEGRWLTVRAVRLRGPVADHSGVAEQIGIVLEPATADDLGSLLLSAHGLTPAQTRVVALVLRGCSTREIVDRLHISANTVQEHLTAVFTRFGVRSRRELVTAVLSAGRH